MDLIKRDDAIKGVRESKAWHFNEIVPVLSAIKGIPSAEKQGEWIDYACSECGGRAYDDDGFWMETNFCPECGARMKGADDE